MYNYMIELIDGKSISIFDKEKIIDMGWNTYHLTNNCKLYISKPKNKGDIYIFENAIVFGKLFEKINGKSVPAKLINNINITIHDILDNFWGSYISIFHDENNVEIFKGPSSSIECLWYNDKNLKIAFSDIDSLFKITEINFKIDKNYIASTLCFNRVNNTKTALKNVNCLKSGHKLSIISSDIECIWSPIKFVNNRNNMLNDNDLENLLKDTVIDCISSWGNAYEKSLLNLSGGLDSSIIAICLKLFSETDLISSNINFDDIVGGELKYAKELCDTYNIPLNVTTLNKSKIKVLNKFEGFPIQYRPLKYGLGFDCLDEEEKLLIKENIQVIFSGCGGDFLFQNMNSIFISQDYYRDKGIKGLFTTSARVAELTNRTVWDIFIKSIKSKYFKGKKYIYERYMDYNIINKKYSSIINANYVSHPWHQDITNLHNGKKYQIAGLIDSDNFYTYRKTSEYVDIIHPLLSQPLIELCLSIPSYRLTSGLINRSLIRSAFKDYLPQNIYLRRGKGKIGSVYDELIKYNYDDICNTLNDGNLINNEILSKNWLKLKINKGVKDSNVRMELFQLLTTELWFKNILKGNINFEN